MFQNYWQGERNRPLQACRPEHPMNPPAPGYISGSNEKGEGFTIWIEDEEIFKRVQAKISTLSGKSLPELTYESLKAILEMSGFASEEAAYIVKEMREKQWPPTLGSFLASHRLSPDAIDALIEAYRQYTSGKLEGISGNQTRIEALTAALKPFAEDPATFDDKSCHAGICSKEECKRCGAAIAAWEALHPIKKALKEK